MKEDLMNAWRLIVVALLAVLSESAIAMSGTNVLMMPRDLVDFARANGCDQVSDFFDRSGMIGPPYAYGYLSGHASDSAVLWCEPRGRAQRRFMLLVMAAPHRQTEMDRREMPCPMRFEWPNYPGGLSIVEVQNLSPHAFGYVGEPDTKPPANARATGKMVVNNKGGTEEHFLCCRGRWVRRFLH